MRKLILVMTLLAMPLFGLWSSAPASAAAPSNMTRIDTAAGGPLAEQARCYYKCHRVCVKRNYHGHCTYWTRKCHRVCHHGYGHRRYH